LIQGDQSFTHRKPGNPEILGNGVLVDSGARAHPTGKNRLANVIGDVVGEVAPPRYAVDRILCHDSSCPDF
jgi:hypothetical protein